MGDIFAVKYRKSNSNRPGLLILALIIFISILFYASVAIAVDITLTWNTSGGATGYKLFHREAGQSYNYSVPDWQGPGTTGTVYGLDGSKIYHFVVRAYNSNGESGDSNEETYPPGLNPAISVSTSGLTTSCSEGANASSQTFTVQNTGGGTLSYTISDNRSWLSISPSSGTSTGEQDSITVNYSTSGLVAGNYSGTITVTDGNATNSPQTISVSLTVNPVSVPPSITLGASSISNSSTQGSNASSQTFTVQNTGGGTLSYAISDNRSWLSCSPSSGTSTGEQYHVQIPPHALNPFSIIIVF